MDPEDRGKKELTITLHNIMKFDMEPFLIHILNTGEMVHTFSEYVDAAVMLA